MEIKRKRKKKKEIRLTDKDDNVGGRSSENFTSPGRSDRFQRGFFARHEDRRRCDVSDEFQRCHRFQQSTVPVAIAIGFLEILVDEMNMEKSSITYRHIIRHFLVNTFICWCWLGCGNRLQVSENEMHKNAKWFFFFLT